MKDTLTVQVFQVGGTVHSRWTAWSATAGCIRTELDRPPHPACARLRLRRLDNSGSYRGPAVDLKPVLDGLLFNWNMYAWLVTPSLAMEWADVTPERRMRIRTHAAYSWIQSFDESNRVLGFRENAGTYSVRGEYAAPTGLRIIDRSVDWVGFASYGGFFGGNRGALGFTTVSEVGAGLESPFDKGNPLGQQVRVSAELPVRPEHTRLDGRHRTGILSRPALRFAPSPTSRREKCEDTGRPDGPPCPSGQIEASIDVAELQRRRHGRTPWKALADNR